MNSEPVLTFQAGRYRVHSFTTLDGTNAEAQRNGARPGTAYIAGSQTSGRGRAGRTWQSPAGNFYGSLVTDVPAGQNPAQLAFVAALAVLDCLTGLVTEITPSLKWPNDVLVRDRKVAGILIEAGDGGYVIGIGINLQSSPGPEQTRYPATDLLAITGRTIRPESVLEPLLSAFDRRRDSWVRHGAETILTDWLASGHRIGDTIAASTATGRIHGAFAGLDQEGALLIDDIHGMRHVVSAGEVIFSGDE